MASYAGLALLLTWIFGGQALSGRVDAALALPLLMPGALVFARLTRGEASGQRRRLVCFAILALLILQMALHFVMAQRIGAAQLLYILAAGGIGLSIAAIVERRSRGWRRLIRWPAFGLAIALWFFGGQALNGVVYADPLRGAERQRVVMLTSLPLRWNGGAAGLAQMLAEGPADLPALAEIERSVDLTMVDTLEANLPPDATLLLAHPPALTPYDLMRIDDHRRSGGRIVILADALSSWPPSHPLGDPRNPPVTSLLTPLLDHWGITLAAPAANGAGDIGVLVDPERALLRLHSAGRFVKLPPQCRAYGRGLVARCDGGKLWLVGDADMLDAGLWRPPFARAPLFRRSDNLAWLVEILRDRRSSGFRPLWIRPRS